MTTTRIRTTNATRIVNRDGAQVYCMRPGDEFPYIQLWPSYGFLAEYQLNGTNEILWYASEQDADREVEKWSAQIRYGDDFAFVWPLGQNQLLPDRIKEIYTAAWENEDTRYFYVVRFNKAPGNPSAGFDFWIDAPNTAMEDGFVVCGPLLTEKGAEAARHQLVTDPSISGRWDIYVGWSYEYDTSTNTNAPIYSHPWSLAHNTGRLLDPISHRAESCRENPNISTIVRFEGCRQLLGHGGLVGGTDLTHLLNLHIPWAVPSWVPRDPLAGTLASGEPGSGWTVPRFPADAFRVVNPWSVAAARYVLAIHNLSRDDEYGFSVPSLMWWHDRPLLLHMTCTGNTVLLASESTITGWSWTRTELGGVSLTFGPPPDWLAPLLSLSAPHQSGTLLS